MAIFDCARMAKNWSKILAKKLGITDEAKIRAAESYYKSSCDTKTESNWKAKMETIFST